MEVRGINGVETVTSKCIQLSFRAGNNQVWTTRLVTYPEMPIKFQAPQFSTQDIKYLQSKSIDAHQIMQLKAYNSKPIDIILGSDFVATIASDLMDLCTK
uniref:Uncharacterized protein n=1 Tax=Caenorhabditis japonica TaxID=281687 RepID=A0A8R1DPE8_CAEJA